MKISKEEIDRVGKVISKLPYSPYNESKSVIVFPISNETKEEIGDLELIVKSKNDVGVAKDPIPALVLSSEGAKLGYVDLTYARNFNIRLYCELLDHDLSNNASQILSSIECYMVEKAYVLAIYNFN